MMRNLNIFKKIAISDNLETIVLIYTVIAMTIPFVCKIFFNRMNWTEWYTMIFGRSYRRNSHLNSNLYFNKSDKKIQQRNERMELEKLKKVCN